ncbi:aminoacyl-tRNA hydrolase [Opitutales bacterium]|nr:aminoacyl-tRNA hydrolase [Opitutales bacterium]
MNLIILGLGNPGTSYEYSRHNVGHLFVNRLAEFHKSSFHANQFFEVCSFPFEDGKLTLLKSVNYMNKNGFGLKGFLGNIKGTKHELVIVHDELDLPLGRAKFSLGKSAAGHNGVSSVLEQLDFSPPRLRVGIEATRPRNLPPSEFVLSRFTCDEQITLGSMFPTLFHSLKLIVNQGLSFAMNYTNSYPSNKPATI